MRKKLLIVGGSLVCVFVLLMLGALALVSPEWEITRTRLIAAPQARIHATVADLHGWPEWTAWSREADPDAVWSFEGAPAGQGAIMRWSGPRFGQGHLTITKAELSGIEYEMVMESNGGMTVLGEISYRPVEGGTEVSWHDRGDLGWNPLLRVLKPVFETTMGGAFEKGLEGLAERIEKAQR